MKTFYLSLFAAAFALTASAGVTETFTSGQGDWKVDSKGTGVVEDGHLNVTMALQNNDKYRADLIYDQETTLSSSDKIVAIKFIGDRPAGALKLNYNSAKTDINSSNAKLLTTNNGNKIYYFEITPSEDATHTKLQFKIADCPKPEGENPPAPTYSVDWIKIFESVDALTADKDWKDDGENDADEVVVGDFPVQIEGKAGYSNLTEAWDAAVDGDVIILNENQAITSRRACDTRKLTLKAGKANTVTRATNFNNKGHAMFLANKKDGISGSLTLDGITLDGGNVDVTGATLEQADGDLIANNVTVQNVKGSGNAYVVAKSTKTAKFNGLTVKDCTPGTSTQADVFVGHNNATFSGNNKCTIHIEKDHFIKAGEDLANNEPVELRCDAARATDTKIVENCADPTQFKMGTPGFTLVAKEGHLHVSKTETSLIDVIGSDDDNAPVEYFNLQGVRVENPENGLYIRRQGKKVEKVFVR